MRRQRRSDDKASSAGTQRIGKLVIANLGGGYVGDLIEIGVPLLPPTAQKSRAQFFSIRRLSYAIGRRNRITHDTALPPWPEKADCTIRSYIRCRTWSYRPYVT
jgi:hypothetical protein